MSLIIIKPDAVKANQVGKIIDIFEQKGYYIRAMKLAYTSVELMETHYAEHKGKDFFNTLCKSFENKRVVALVVDHKKQQKPSLIAAVRRLVGTVDTPGSIRGVFAKSFEDNSVHASDSEASAKREIKLWFPECAFLHKA